MKKQAITLGFLILSVCTFYGQESTLIVDAGNDTCVCSYSETILGGNPTVQGGTPPYTYCWYGVYEVWPGLLYEYASTILNDTTLANPVIIGGATYFESYVIHLMVTDSLGNQGWDSVLVCCSHYGCLTWNPDAAIVLGDSAMLYEVCWGGFSPHTYLWSPTDGLSDPTNLNTYASPEQTTWYYLEMWDSCGCSLELSGGGSPFYVRVIPVGIDIPNSNSDFLVSPNPNSGTFRIQTSLQSEKINIQIFDIMGMMVSTMDINTNEQIEIKHLKPGIYFIHINKKLKNKSIIKMIID